MTSLVTIEIHILAGNATSSDFGSAGSHALLDSLI